MRVTTIRPVAATTLLVAFLHTAAAQGWQTSLDKTQRPTPPATKAKAPTAPPPVPSRTNAPPLQALYLVRSTLLSLADANRSGNYSVLRDLASPAFAQRNTAADLAQTFAPVRNAKVDLASAALLEPMLEGPPMLEEGRLRLKGALPSRPQIILFDLAFEAVAGNWRLHSLSVAARPVETPVAHK